MTYDVRGAVQGAFPLLLMLVGLTLAVFLDPYIRAERGKIMMVIIALSFSIIAQNTVEDYLAFLPARSPWRTPVAVYGYVVRPVILVLFLSIIQPKRWRWVWWLLAGINAAIYMTALFSPLCFWIDESNHYHGGPLRNVCLVISAFLLVELFIQTLKSRSMIGKREQMILIIIVLVILGSIFMDYTIGDNQPVAYLTMAMVASGTLYYICLHLQFVREYEWDLMAQQRIEIMLSQIRPHFLYNALGSIEALCDSDPATAKMAARNFSKYLRGKMNSLTEERLIPFEREMQYTKTYLYLEQVRFEDALQVEYHISTQDFLIPPLSLEPIVENAVKHGIRENDTGRGTVRISTEEYEDRYEVRVEDDGAGFDPQAIPNDRPHVGIRNVRERLERICGGALLIDSAPGRGTVAIIRLPKKKKEES